MEFIKFVFTFICFTAEHKLTSSIEPLNCLLEEKHEPCSAVEDTNRMYRLQNIHSLSPQILYDVSRLDKSLKKAILAQNFSGVREEEIVESPGGIILSIPTCHLRDLNGRVLGALLLHWSNNEAIFKHIVRAFLHPDHVETLSQSLQSHDFLEDNLKWIAEAVSFTIETEARDLTNLPTLPLVLYSPPEAILNTSPERIFFLSMLDDPDDQRHLSSNKPAMRFWSYAMISKKVPDSLMNWNSFYVERWGFFLTGGTINELSQLREENIDMSVLFSLNFSPLQMRFLFDNFFSKKDLGEKEFLSLSQAFTTLLPSQLSLFPIKMGRLLSKVKIPSKMSYSSSRQLLEFIYASQSYKYANYPFSHFVYALPVEIFQTTISQPLNMSQIFKIQSTQLTKSQMLYISEKHNLFNFKSQDIFRCSEYIQVLPTSVIMFNDSASHVLLHIVSKIDSSNIPQTFAVLNKLWPQLSTPDVFKKIMDNNEFRAILDYIPARYFLKKYGDLELGYYNKKTYMFVSSIIRELKETSDSKYYSNKPLTLVHTRLTCDDVSMIDPYNFIMFLSEYNAYIKMSNKVLSKTLQKCCVNKLLEVLQLKSLLIPKLPLGSKLSLLNEAEIDAVGGYILSALPITSISNSKHTRFIVKTIGKLKVPELLTAVPLTDLQKLSSLLAQTISPTENIAFSLFDFGNLTLFLEPQYINKINREYLKLFLEGNYLDHRICAKQSVRYSWYKLIIQIFGEPETWNYQTLVTLGDFMIVVPKSDLMKIRDDQWIYAVDNILTKYYDAELDSDLKFFEICLAHLNLEEKSIYMQDLRNYITTLVRAAQLQIDTVVSAKVLIERNKNYKNGGMFSFMGSNKDIKLSFSPTKIVIQEKPTQTTKPSIFEIKHSNEIASSPTTTEYLKDNSNSMIEEFHFRSTTDQKPDSIKLNSKHPKEFTREPNLELSKNYYSSVNYDESSSTSQSYHLFNNEGNNYKLFSTSETEAIPDTTTEEFKLSSVQLISKLVNKKETTTENIIESTEKHIVDGNKYTVIYNENISNDPSREGVNFIPGNYTSVSSTASTHPFAIITDNIDNSKEIFGNLSFMLNMTSSLSTIESSYEDGKLQTLSISNSESDRDAHKNIASPTENVNMHKQESTDKIKSRTVTIPFEPTVNTTGARSLDKSNIVTSDAGHLKVILGNDTKSDIQERKVFLSSKNINFDIENNFQKQEKQLLSNNSSVNTFLNYKHPKEIFSNTFIDLSTNDIENRNTDSNKGPENLQYFKLKPQLLKKNISYFMSPKVIRKRSSEEKWSCEALKIVGISVEIIVDESIISNLEDRDLINCIDLFAKMNLPKNIQTIIWKRLNIDNFVIAGKLISACDLSDIQNKTFSYEHRWFLENIHLLGKYNTKPDVRNHIANEVWRNSKKPLTAELIASLGPLICDLPDINSGIIHPEDLYKTSIVLGKALPCNYTCLSRIAEIAVDKKSFNDPSTWSFEDVHDLGIIISGLNVSGWRNFILRNHEALKGLSETAYKCLPYTYKKMMRRIPIDILPKSISNRFMEYDTLSKLMEFEFYNPETSPESTSFANSSFSFNKYILIISILLLKLSCLNSW